MYLLEDKLNKLIQSFEINLNKTFDINKFIRDLKLNITDEKDCKKYPIHIIFKDADCNIIKIETMQNLKSPFIFKEKIENSKEVSFVKPIMKN